MDNDFNSYCYIQEQTSVPEDYTNGFGYQVHDKGNRFYLTFPAVLQSFNEINRNGRYYDKNNIWNLIQTDDYIQSMLKQNSWCGEIDHPTAEKVGEELTVERIANPCLRLTSHFIRSPRMNGDLLEANIQTDSSNENGMNMAIKIVDGKIIPCFSARVFGALRNINGRPTVYTRKLITYDWVLFPSHEAAKAKITQPLMESVKTTVKNAMDEIGGKVIFLKELAQMAANSSKETEWLCESFNLTMDDIVGVTKSGNSIVINEGSNVYVQPIRDKFVRCKVQNNVKDWINS